MSQASSTRPEIVKERIKYAGKAIHKFPSKPMPHGILFNFYEYNYNAYINAVKAGEEKGTIVANEGAFGFVPQLNARAEVANKSSLELPFPRQLTDTQNIRVSQFERDFLLERIVSGLSQFGGPGGTTGDFLGGLTEGVKKGLAAVRESGFNFASDPLGAAKEIVNSIGDIGSDKAIAMASYLARNIIGGDLSKTLGVVGQRVVNPQETLAFSGVDLRNFTFTWDLYPSNKTDTTAIMNIVNFLKSRSLPMTEAVDDTPSLNRAFLRYPDIVEINLLGVQESHFTRFKRAMISNVTVDYGGGSQVSIIKGGVPAAVTLTVGFSEVQIHTAEDYGRTTGETKTDETPFRGAAR